MKARIAHLWADHKLLFLAFVLAVFLTLMFAMRAIMFLVIWSDPARRNQPLEPWMTPYYIAHSYDLEPDTVLQMIGIKAPKRMHPTLEWIAKTNGRSTADLIADLTRQLDARKIAKP
jgi:hypothetical protein